jgi:hypothetical protein
MNMPEARDPKGESSLNPTLQARTESTYDTTSSPAPVDTVSATEGEGEGWPLVWLFLAIIGVALTVYFIV